VRNRKAARKCLLTEIYINTVFYSIPHSKSGYRAFGVAGCFLKVLQMKNIEYVGAYLFLHALFSILFQFSRNRFEVVRHSGVFRYFETTMARLMVI